MPPAKFCREPLNAIPIASPEPASRVCVYSKRIYGHKDEHKGERYGGEAEGEGGDGGVYVAALHYLADNSLYLLYDPGSYDVDGNGCKHLHPNLYSLFQKQ